MKILLLSLLLLFTFEGNGQDAIIQATTKKKFKDKEFYKDGSLKARGKRIRQTRLSGLSNIGRVRCAVMGAYKVGRWVEYYPSGKRKRIVVYTKKEERVVKTWADKG